MLEGDSLGGRLDNFNGVEGNDDVAGKKPARRYSSTDVKDPLGRRRRYSSKVLQKTEKNFSSESESESTQIVEEQAAQRLRRRYDTHDADVEGSEKGEKSLRFYDTHETSSATL